MQALLKVSSGLDWIVSTIGKLAAWIVLPLVAIIMFDIITRKIQPVQQAILNSPLHAYISSTKLQEWEWHLHTVLFLLALGYAYVHNAHVRVDLVREKLPQKTQVCIELIGLLFFMIPYVSLVFYYGWAFVQQSYESNEVSSAMTGLSNRWIIKSFVLAGLVLAFMAGVSAILKCLAYLFGPRESRESIYLPMVTGLAGHKQTEALKADAARSS
jgi:TRAP-type mannitol/chloroaromatic compound transport system permease small subunit